MPKTKIMYLRDEKNFRVACVAFSVNKGRKKISYQVSTVNPSDFNDFDRSLGRQIAIGRLIEKPIELSLPKDVEKNFDIETLVLANIATAKGVPTRTKNAAQNWFKNQTNVKKEEDKG